MTLKYRFQCFLRRFKTWKSHECRYCEKWVWKKDNEPTFATWADRSNPFHGSYPCHKTCKKAGEAEEAYLCQSIDRDCNDCVFFKRGKMVAKESSTGVVFEGHCLKFDKPTRAFPGQATGHPCFVHRKEEEFNKLGYKDGMKV